MFTTRQKHLQQYLQQANNDIAFISSPINIQYFTGFHAEPHERFFAFLYDTTTKTSFLFLPALDLEAANKVAVVDEIIPIADTENGFERMQSILDSPIHSIAVEKDTMTVLELEELKQRYEGIEVTGVESFIQQERLYKTEAEIQSVKKAIDITEKGLTHMIDFVEVGMTEMEIKMELEFYVQSLGAEQMAFDTLVLTGANAALPHGVSGLRKVEEGDFLLFDFGVTVDGYHSDLTRTFIVGEATEEQQRMYNLVKKANIEAIDAVVLNEPIKSIDLAARQTIEKASYGDYFIHRTGHGLGLEVHEAPSIHAENNTLITAGLLFTIEPGIYVPGLGGVRIEDNIYVNEAGEVEVLTSFPKQLTSIS